jgi:IS605 OrfB family transposase
MKYVYPTLLQTANDINSFSWFNIKKRTNSKKKVRKKVQIKEEYTDTIKFKLFLTDKQKNKLKLWLDDCIDIYNLTNQYIKDNKLTKSDINFYKLRALLKTQIKDICKINKLQKHTADYSVKHCVEMYKSAFSNRHKNFTIKNLQKDRRRKNLVIEPTSFNKKINSFFNLGTIKSSLKFADKIHKNSILQYDSYINNFIIITPQIKETNKELDKSKKCGIDIGVRTFATTYSRSESYEIGTNTYPIIDGINKRLDNIREHHDIKILTNGQYKKLWYKYSDRLKNKISDLHNKTANFLLRQYKKINIGKVSIKSMISNLTGNLYKIVKRRLVALSHYKFREKLKSMSNKFGCKVNEINEYQTSIKCHNCNKLKRDLGSNKHYNCSNCNLSIDRDINASINIYKLE